MSNQQVGFRKMMYEDCERGVVVRITGMSDEFYNAATVIGLREPIRHEESHIILILARPYAYAAEHWDSKQPLMGCEVFDCCFNPESTDLEVYVNSKGELRTMKT
jgi:hypothetical protein